MGYEANFHFTADTHLFFLTQFGRAFYELRIQDFNPTLKGSLAVIEGAET